MDTTGWLSLPGGSTPGCLGCRSSRVLPLIAFSDVPVQSTMVLRSADEAGGFPRAEMALAYCEDCGLISNTAFNPDLVHYGKGFEESQFASPTFRAFAETLADRLVTACGEGPRRVVELGCGKGEFLELLCRREGVTGVGIDPACDADRLDPAVRDRIEVVEAFYDDAHREIIHAADLVCCRHTLEHLADPLAFFRRLRDHLADRPGTLVYVDAPDTDHVIDQGAFWEMNYEHCGYYTPASLAGLLRRAGFGLQRVEVGFSGQNLGAWATTGPDAPDEPPAAREPARNRARLFADNARRAVHAWHDALHHHADTVLWGSGSRAVGFMGAASLTERHVAGVVDINPRRQGLYMPGYQRPIIPPDELARLDPGRVVVMNPIYAREIAAALADLGLHTEVLTIDHPPAADRRIRTA